MKKIFLGLVFISVSIGLYTLFVTDKEEKKSSILKVKDKSKPILEQKAKVVHNTKEKVIKIKKRDDSIEKTNDEIITDSKVLKDLYVYLQARDWDAFDEVYGSKIKLLRENGDHTQFYQDFKDFFIKNNLSSDVAVAILALLSEASTKESISLIFEMFDEGIISDKEVELQFVTHFANSISISREDPSIDFKGVVASLQHGYQTTENDYLRRGAAVLLARYETPSTEVMLFRDYMEAKTPEKQRAAYEGLMSMDGTAMLPNLRSYLTSEYEDVKTTAGMVLANMVTDEAIEVFSDWIITDAKIEDMPNIKKWLSKVMKRVGVSRVRKTINIDKIRSQEFRIELEDFFDEEQEREKASVSSN